MYLAHMRQIYEENFLDGSFEKRAQELQKKIRKAYLDDPFKEYQIIDFDKSINQTIGSKSKIPGLLELMDKRVKFLRKHDDFKVLASNVIEVKQRSREAFDNKTVNTFIFDVKLDNFPKRCTVYYKFDEKADYSTAVLYDDMTNGDYTAGDNTYSCIIDPKGQYDTIYYYVYTENAGAASFYPTDYMKKPLKVSLGELNK
jgi:hypothetical protein